MPRTPDVLDPRQRLLAAGYVALLLALVPAYAAWAPASDLGDPVTLAALVALGVISMRSEAALPAQLALGSLSGLSLVTIVLLGPLPALLVLAVALVTPALTGQERLLRPGNLSNLASHGSYVLVASVVLAELGDGVAGLTVAIVAQLFTNWAVGPALFTTLWLGLPVPGAVAAGRRGVPGGLLVGALAGIAALLAPLIGPGALAIFALVVVVPHATLAYLAQRGHVSRLTRPELTARYARALALEARLDRPQRDRVDAVARLVAARRPTGAAVDHMVATLADRSAAACDAGHLTEWVDGTGGPAGVSGGMIPIAARVVAVADSWAGLTAAGTQGLSHAEAIAELRAEAGYRLDPDLVADAERIALGLPPAREPGVHSRWLPAVVGRHLLAAT